MKIKISLIEIAIIIINVAVISFAFGVVIGGGL